MKAKSLIVSSQEAAAIAAATQKAFISTLRLPKWAHGVFIARTKDGILTGVHPHDEHERAERNGVQYDVTPYRIGQEVYVRETITHNSLGGAIYKGGGKVTMGRDLEQYEYIHIDDLDKTDRGYIPSCQMKEKHARTRLVITGVDYLRVQDITEEQAIQLGMSLHEDGKAWLNYLYQKYNTTQFVYCERSAKRSFQSWWEARTHNKISGTWRDNPHVFYFTFEKK